MSASISKKAVINYHLDPNMPAIEADASQLRQIIMNLITNASEAIREKDGTISLRTGVVDADERYLSSMYMNKALAPGEYAYLEVTDTGCGINEEVKEKIFDPFFSTKSLSRGLGLASTMGIIRRHKGAIHVHSEPGRGSTFRLIFPCSKNATVPVNAPRKKPIWRGGGTVLVVDDEETSRNVSKRMLEKMGYAVMTANNGEEAIKILKSHFEKIVVVLLDLNMPKMNGMETFEQICLNDKFCNVPVILVSGYDKLDVAERSRDKGFAGFIQKPFTYQRLLNALQPLFPAPAEKDAL